MANIFANLIKPNTSQMGRTTSTGLPTIAVRPGSDIDKLNNNVIFKALSSVGNYATKPVRDLGELITQIGLASKVKRVESPSFTNEQLKEFGSSKAFNASSEVQKYKKESAKSQDAYKKLQGEISNPSLISKEEQQSLYDYSTALKDAAIVGSFIMPSVGTGLTGALTTGAASGAMGGFGGSKKGEELQGTLTGAALGGAMSGIGYGAGKLVKGIGDKLTNRITKQVDDIDVAASSEVSKMSKLQKQGIVDQAQQAGLRTPGETTDATVAKFLKMRELTGMKTGTAQEVIDKTSSALDNFSNAKDSALKAMSIGDTATTDISNSLSKNLSKEVGADDMLNSQVFSSTINDIKSAAQQGAEALDDLAIKFRDKVNYKQGTTAGVQTVQPITQEQQVIYDNAADAIVSYLKGVSNSTDGLYTQSKQGLSETLRILGGKELPKVIRANENGLRAYGIGISENILPVNAVSSWASRGIGRGKEIIGNVPSAVSGIGNKLATTNTSGVGNVLSNIGATVENVAPKAGGVLGALGTQSILNPQPQSSATQGTPETIQQIEGYYIDPVTGYLHTPSMGTTTSSAGGTDFVSALAQAQELLPGGDASTILSYAKAIMDASGGSTTANATQGKINAVLSSVDQAESLLDAGASAGFGQGALTGIGNILGTSNELNTQYQSAIAGVNTTLATLLTGTAQTESETRKLANMTINPNDSERAVRAKLQLIKSYVSAYIGQ